MDDLPHILLTPMQAEAAAADGISGRTHAHGTGNVWLSLTLRAVSALTDIAADLGERLRASIADDGLGTDAVLGLPDNGQTLTSSTVDSQVFMAMDIRGPARRQA